MTDTLNSTAPGDGRSGVERSKPGLFSFRSLPVQARPHLMVVVLIAIGQAIALAGVALGLTRLLSHPERWEPLTLTMVVLAVIASVWLRFRERLDGERLGQEVAHATRLAMAAHLLKLPTRGSRPVPRDVLLRFIGDLTALKTWYARGSVSILVGAPLLITAVTVIALQSWHLGAMLGLVILVGILVQTLLLNRLRDAGNLARRQRGRLARFIVDRTEALSSVQAYSTPDKEVARIDKRSRALTTTMIDRTRWAGALRAIAEAAASSIPLLVLLDWKLTGSVALHSAATTVIIGGLLTPRIRELGRVLEYHALATISRNRIAAFLGRTTLDERSDARTLRKRGGDVRLRGLELAGVFNPLGFKAAAGARIALTGRNGSGKSRLLGVIAGLEEPTAGYISIDHQSTAKRSMRSLRRIVALASVEAPLMRGSVDANIRHRRADDLETQLAAYGYRQLIDELNQGGDTRIGPRGEGVSLGQEKRIILLRALARQPAILLLDEIEANLDAAGLDVLDSVFANFPGTIIVATHSRQLIDKCDSRWDLDEPG